MSSSPMEDEEVVRHAWGGRGMTPGVEGEEEYEEGPMTLEEEMAWVENKYPGVNFDKVNLATRTCTLTLQRSTEVHSSAPAIPSGFLRIDMYFPPQYPDHVAPVFEIQKTGMVSMANRMHMSTKLGQIAQACVGRGSACLEACVRYLLHGDPASSSGGGVSTSSTPIPIASTAVSEDGTDLSRTSSGFLAGMADNDGSLGFGGEIGFGGALDPDVRFNDDDDEDTTSSSDAEGLAVLGGRLKRKMTDKRMLQEVIVGRDNSNVPFPRLCGATFSANGKLVYFFSQLPHPSSTKFMAYTLTTRNQQPVLQSQHFDTQPKTYPLYENYRAFVLARFPKKFSGAAPDARVPEGDKASRILTGPLSQDSGAKGNIDDYWLDDEDEDEGDEGLVPSLFWRPKPGTSLQPDVLSSADFMSKLKTFTSPSKRGDGASGIPAPPPLPLTEKMGVSSSGRLLSVSNTNTPVAPAPQTSLLSMSFNPSSTVPPHPPRRRTLTASHSTTPLPTLGNEDDRMDSIIPLARSASDKPGSSFSLSMFANSNSNLPLPNDLPMRTSLTSKRSDGALQDLAGTPSFGIPRKQHPGKPGHRRTASETMNMSGSEMGSEYDGSVGASPARDFEAFGGRRQADVGSMHDLPERDLSNSGGGLAASTSAGISFGGADGGVAGSAVGIAAGGHGTVVAIRDVESLLPTSEKLGRLYTLSGDNPVAICAANSAAAKQADRLDLAQIWGLAGLVLTRYADLGSSTSTTPDGQSPAKPITASARRVRPSRQRKRRPADGTVKPRFTVERDGSIVATDARDKEDGVFGTAAEDATCKGVDWQWHPFGRQMVHTIFRHLERIGDVQTLALLSCVFSESFAFRSDPGKFVASSAAIGRIPPEVTEYFQQTVPQTAGLQGIALIAPAVTTSLSRVGVKISDMMPILAGTPPPAPDPPTPTLSSAAGSLPTHDQWQHNAGSGSAVMPIGGTGPSSEPGTPSPRAISGSHQNGKSVGSLQTPQPLSSSLNSESGMSAFMEQRQKQLQQQRSVGGADMAEDKQQPPPPPPPPPAPGGTRRGRSRGTTTATGNQPAAVASSSSPVAKGVVERTSENVPVPAAMLAPPVASTSTNPSMGGTSPAVLPVPPSMMRQRTAEAWVAAWHSAMASGALPGAQVVNTPGGVLGWTLTAPVTQTPGTALTTPTLNAGGIFGILGERVTPGSNTETPGFGNNYGILPTGSGAGGNAAGGGKGAVLMLRLTADGSSEYAGAGRAPPLLPWPPVELLDPARRTLYDGYRVRYAEMLYHWGMLEQRAQVLKFVAGPDIFPKCLSCGIDLMPGHRETYCGSCQREQYEIRCAICRLPCKGLINVCMLCEHGGHARHIRDWFVNKGEVECPAGCGCACAIGNGGFGGEM
ncbi:GATOR complex protein wdr59 [Borealophlyctis nickersoniae]|nr:GATOR complex protein wdr59 [Borealophlyctis nickersoniae]